MIDMCGASRSRLKGARMAWNQLDTVSKVKAFVDCTIAPTFRLGAQALMMTAGLGGMRPNIVMMGFYNEKSKNDQLVEWYGRLRSFFGAIDVLGTERDQTVGRFWPILASSTPPKQE